MRQNGLTLIELILVVAILGLLAASAVPNFQFMTEKARQAEAKAALSGLFTAEQAYFAEYQTYSSEFDQILVGFSGTMLYVVGFSNYFPDLSPAAPPHPLAGNCCWNACKTLFTPPQYVVGDCAPGYLNSVSWTCNLPYGAPANLTAVVTATTFTAGASGLLNGNGNADIWTLDQSQNLINVSNGL